MTIEEAVTALESAGAKGGDWAAWTAARNTAFVLLGQVPAESLAPWRERLRALCVTSWDGQVGLTAAVALVRLSLDDPGALLPLFGETPGKSYLFDALTRVGAEGGDIWPLVKGILAAPGFDELAMECLLSEVLVPDEVGVQRFAELAAHSPEFTARLASQLSMRTGRDFGAFLPTMVELACTTTDRARLRALEALGFLAGRHRLDARAAERLESLLASARGEEAELLARIVALDRLSPPAADLEPLLADARVEVRRGALLAVARFAGERPGCWSLLLRAGRDVDPAVQQWVFSVARLRMEEGLRLDDALTRALVESLAGPAGEATAIFLSFAARWQGALVREAMMRAPASEAAARLQRTLDAPGTRVCAACGSLPIHGSWNHPSQEPRAYLALERVVTLDGELELLRCPACMAHFLAGSSVEYDVNSRHDHWWFERLKLREIKERYGAHVDLEHHRFRSWESDLRADMLHLDPAVRAVAALELERSVPDREAR
jgi:uncharacterized C2H2 Zn-finger protein